VPLAGQGSPFGILNLAAAGEEPFDEETLSLLDAVGAQLGIAYERYQLAEARRREAERLAAREERDRVARDVHDSVAQLLFGADLSLRLAEEADDPTQARGAVQKGSELVSSALRELRGLVELLRSADLEKGLNAALERLVERTTGTVKVELRADPVSVPEDLAEVLYRTAQEGIHNALRHADADGIVVRLEARPRSLRLAVDDDGRGLPDEVERGVGLRSIEERAASVGGRMRFTGRRGGGARRGGGGPWPERRDEGVGE
jgi:two-component system, NarL family, sensor kinase